MDHFARLRPRLTKLTLPWIFLALISAAVSFASSYELLDWQVSLVWIGAGVATFILWVLPSLRFAATYLDVFSTGITIRSGLGSSKKVQLTWAEIAGVTASPIRGLIVKTKEENEYVLRGYSNQRAVANEITSLLGGK